MDLLITKAYLIILHLLLYWNFLLQLPVSRQQKYSVTKNHFPCLRSIFCRQPK